MMYKPVWERKLNQIIEESRRVFLIPFPIIFLMLIVYGVAVFNNLAMSAFIFWTIIFSVFTNLFSTIMRMKHTSEELEELVKEMNEEMRTR